MNVLLSDAPNYSCVKSCVLPLQAHVRSNFLVGSTFVCQFFSLVLILTLIQLELWSIREICEILDLLIYYKSSLEGRARVIQVIIRFP